MGFCLLFCALILFEKKRFTLKRKKNGSHGEQIFFFHLERNPYQTRAKTILTGLSPFKVYQFPLTPDQNSHEL